MNRARKRQGTKCRIRYSRIDPTPKRKGLSQECGALASANVIRTGNDTRAVRNRSELSDGLESSTTTFSLTNTRTLMTASIGYSKSFVERTLIHGLLVMLTRLFMRFAVPR